MLLFGGVRTTSGPLFRICFVPFSAEVRAVLRVTLDFYKENLLFIYSFGNCQFSSIYFSIQQSSKYSVKQWG
jgi:hypothetical protein